MVVGLQWVAPPRSLCTRVVWKSHIINPASSGPFFTKGGPHSCGGADCSPWQVVSFSAEAVCKSRPGGQAVGLPSQSRIWVVSELHLSCPVPPPWACISVFLPLHRQPIQTRSAVLPPWPPPALQELLGGAEQGRNQQENQGPHFAVFSGLRPLRAPEWPAGGEGSGLRGKLGSGGGELNPALPSLCEGQMPAPLS